MGETESVRAKRGGTAWARYRIGCGCFSACFALVMVLGPCFARGNSWEQARSAPVQSILSFLCYLTPCFVLLHEAGRFFFSGRAAGKQAAADKPALTSFFFLWGLLMLFWMPYLIGFYPGIANSDVPDQLAMSFNMENGSYALIDRPLSEKVLINGHHPVFNTWMQGLFLRVGILAGSQNAGIFLHAVCLAVFTTGVFAYAVYDRRRGGAGTGVCGCLSDSGPGSLLPPLWNQYG